MKIWKIRFFVMYEEKLILSAIIDVGEIMLVSGAEVNRVEDTISRMAYAYGFKRADVFTITYSIIVSVYSADGNVHTQTRRLHGYSTDMYKVERCNSLSRSFCSKIMTADELKKEVNAIRSLPGYSNRTIILCYGVISPAFTLFFGGSMTDAAVSAICGIFLWFITHMADILEMNNILKNLICSALVAFLAGLSVFVGFGDSLDGIIIGNIMLLIPGVAFTTSIRDMINGDIISGLLGLCDALLRAVAIAVGFALVLWKWGGV